MLIENKDWDYDLVLIFTAFQRNCVYVSIIKELCGRYKIAILTLERDQKTVSRIGNTNRQFLELCEGFGADILRDGAVTANVELLAQSTYTEADIEYIDSRVRANHSLWMSGVAMGNANYKNLFGKKIDKVLVPDRSIYDYRLGVYGNDGVDFEPGKVVETGMPYAQYPVFEEAIDADYILANPTPFSFVVAKDRLDYLENVDYFLSNAVRKDDVVAFKPHNADERADYIVSKHLYRAFDSALLRPFSGMIGSVARGLSALPFSNKKNGWLVELVIASVYMKVMRRVVRLSTLTPYHNINLEVFLPGVRKGLITGRSNSIWHALFLRKPVWNCIDEDKPYFSETKMHKYAMTYFGVHGNYREQEFDESLFDVIQDSTRHADLISYLGGYLSDHGARSA